MQPKGIETRAARCRLKLADSDLRGATQRRTSARQSGKFLPSVPDGMVDLPDEKENQVRPPQWGRVSPRKTMHDRISGACNTPVAAAQNVAQPSCDRVYPPSAVAVCATRRDNQDDTKIRNSTLDDSGAPCGGEIPRDPHGRRKSHSPKDKPEHQIKNYWKQPGTPGAAANERRRGPLRLRRFRNPPIRFATIRPAPPDPRNHAPEHTGRQKHN
mmetsp:Transcript_3250/g.7762  ORF Transcript_3250/g.7762 Transcript_3250/m.7762 type:complete len:214 (+) Transcript_3250:58-699(+)